jgi:hypothetical protein
VERGSREAARRSEGKCAVVEEAAWKILLWRWTVELGTAVAVGLEILIMDDGTFS